MSSINSFFRGHDVSLVFQTLPDRKLIDYYKIIKKPLSLFMIKVGSLLFTRHLIFIFFRVSC
jgi:hypothetical protein